jgi:hypothetical protein
MQMTTFNNEDPALPDMPATRTAHTPSAESSSQNIEQTREQKRLENFDNLAWQLQSEMPSDVMLKGDGSLWVVNQGDTRARKISQQDALKLIYTAILRSNQLISV